MITFTILIPLILTVSAKLPRYDSDSYLTRLSDHKLVTDTNVFPYVVAILKKQSYMSAGALLNDKWVLTAANSLYLVRETSRMIRVRLGSINYKKGGELLPVKSITVHPKFDATKPLFDVALIRLAGEVWLTAALYPVRMQARRREVTASHFIVTAWTPSVKVGKKAHHRISIESIKRQRMLSVSHLHPAEPGRCDDELAALDIVKVDSLMCLDADFKADPCWRDVGAPVVLNGVLWGVVSSWRPAVCRAQNGSHFVTLVAAREVRDWIATVTEERVWNDTVRDSLDDSRDNQPSEETNEI